MDMVNQVWSDQGKVVKCCEDMVVNTMVNIDTMNRELISSVIPVSFQCRFKLSESDGDGDGDDGDDGNRAAYIRKPKASFWEQGKRHSNHSSSFQWHSRVLPVSDF